MDLIKKLTGKNPAEFEYVANLLVNNADVELFKTLVKQDDFLFDFVKNNVSNRIKNACNKENHKNLVKFFEYYSVSYANMFAEVLFNYGKNELLPTIKDFIINGNDSQKAYATKYYLLENNENILDIIEQIRINAKSENEFLSTNSIELLAKINDTKLKEEALENLNSNDEFTQYDSIKFLVNFGAKDCLNKIIEVMKKSSLSENIAAEILFLTEVEELQNKNFDDANLVLCNLLTAIPEILPSSYIADFDLYSVLENLYYNNLTSTSAIVLKLTKDKIAQLLENDEYLYDCDKNTKTEIESINKFLVKINDNKLISLIYEELYDESDFVLYAIDYIDNKTELETLLDSKNPTVLLKTLNKLKELGALSSEHKQSAKNTLSTSELIAIIDAI